MEPIKTNYIIIPLTALITMLVGTSFTSRGIEWYQTCIKLPSFTPPHWAFGIVWAAIFMLATAAALIVWNTFDRTREWRDTIALFIVNAVLNALWSYLFFVQHDSAAALLDAMALEATILGLMIFISHQSLPTALLLLPYALWVGFAIVLNWTIWLLNR